MAIDWLARMRFMFNKATARVDSRLNLDDIERYWNYPRAGDPFLEAYQESRSLTGSTDDLAKQMRFHTLMHCTHFARFRTTKLLKPVYIAAFEHHDKTM